MSEQEQARPQRGGISRTSQPDTRGRPSDAGDDRPLASDSPGQAAGAAPSAGVSPALAEVTAERPEARSLAPPVDHADPFRGHDPYDMSQYSRRTSLLDDPENPFDIPERLRKLGWDYQWNPSRVLGQPIEDLERQQYHAQGWRPAPARDFLEMLPPGYSKPYVELGGMVLEMRPLSLSQEAKQELAEKAERQKQDKLRSALAGDPGDQSGQFRHDRRMPRTAATITLEGEVGVAEQRYRAAAR